MTGSYNFSALVGSLYANYYIKQHATLASSTTLGQGEDAKDALVY
jgi:hypothetical protein